MHDTSTTRPPRAALALLLGALFLSGLAAIVNQTVWQRSLKLYLAGSESASAMIVVLTFMLGLGAGSLCMGFAAGRVRNPLRLLGLVELALFAANAAIAAALALDLGESIYAMQRLAVSLGIPLRLVYGASSAAVLLAPCFLMGITMPLVSEAAQRQLRCQTSSFVAVLFVLNTLGSVAGCLAGGFLLMPYFGQRTSLLVGAACNGTAGVVLLLLYLFRYRRQATERPDPGHAGREPTERRVSAQSSFRAGRLAPEEMLGFWFGFLSLGYEMYVFRAAALAHQPLPYNFSLVLCYYLLFWSAGVYLAKRVRECLPSMLLLSAALLAAMPAFHWLDRRHLHALVGERLLPGGLPLCLSAAVYCLPCIPFGCLFGQTIARFAKSWGRDVGRYYGLNTLGSCLGILAMTLLGYEINHVYAALLLAAGYLTLLVYARRRLELPAPTPIERRWNRGAAAGLAASLLLVAPLQLVYDLRLPLPVPKIKYASWKSYFGKGGVLEVADNGALIWDGLWHSALSSGEDHVGRSNWLLAAVPFLCHGGERIDDALVIGLGTGITAVTLAQSDRVGSVDVYEIDRKLAAVLRDYPEGTLFAGSHPKLRILWQDGRAGLALSDKQYDLITQQPLYLIQAGSSMLLSREYMELVKKRLKPGGIFCIYSNPAAGSAAQALLVRRTAAEVFPYCESFGRGYAVIAANEPFALHLERAATDRSGDRLLAEIRKFGIEEMRGLFDSPRLDWDGCPYVITDNHPLVEYPGVVHYLLRRGE